MKNKNSRSLLEKIKKDMKNKKELLKGAKFFLFVLLWFLALNLIFILFVPVELIESFYAHASLLVLNLPGLQGNVIMLDVPSIAFTNFNYTASITYLCSGILETIVLISCIMASHGIELKKRIQGIGFGIFVLMIANTARIALSILILKFLGNSLGDLFHTILFKLILFFGIAGIYLVWFLWATGKMKPKKK